MQSLIGDSTDNVPGVPGIGVKTAAQLIGEYGDLETLLARARRDQAGEAAPDADRQSPSRRGCRRGWSRSTTTWRSTCRSPTSRCTSPIHKRLDRLPQGDGVHHADAAGGGVLRRRCRRRSSRMRQLGQAAPPAVGGAQPRRCARQSAAPPAPPAHVRTAAQRKRGAAPQTGELTPQALAAARVEAAPQTPSSTARATRPCAPWSGSKAWIARARDARRGRDRHRDHQPRSDAGRAVRRLAGGRAERGLLRPARPPPRADGGTMACSPAGSSPDQIPKSGRRSTR